MHAARAVARGAGRLSCDTGLSSFILRNHRGLICMTHLETIFVMSVLLNILSILLLRHRVQAF